MIPRFRCWDKENKGMLYEGFVVNPDGVIGTIINDHSWNSLILMQSTGLKDCKGQEVFEGDIIKRGTTVSDIIWEDCGFKLRRGNSVCDVNKPIEIIGNIFQHPDLLTKGA